MDGGREGGREGEGGRAEAKETEKGGGGRGRKGVSVCERETSYSMPR